MAFVPRCRISSGLSKGECPNIDRLPQAPETVLYSGTIAAGELADPRIRKAEAEFEKAKTWLKYWEYQHAANVEGSTALPGATVRASARDLEIAQQDVIVAECNLEIVKNERHTAHRGTALTER